MNLIQSLLLGALQGATEFLPVSSSGHLVLVPWLLGWPVPDLAFGAIVHWGTALAVIVFFWCDWMRLIRAAVSRIGAALRGNGRAKAATVPDARLLALIVLGSVPAAALGYLFEDFFEYMFSRPTAVAGVLLLTASLLALSEWLGHRRRELDRLTWVDALLIGLAQAAAIFPGISRSGATIAAGLGRGLKRVSAARFSFLLGTPIVLGAGLLQVVDLLSSGGLADVTTSLVVSFLAAFAVGFGCIRFLMRHLERGRLYPYAIYCAVAGAGCLVVAVLRGA